MVTGDHMQTALHAAVKCGIIDENPPKEGVCMTGHKFREAIGSYTEKWNPKK